jgi:4-amino-4-deoxy-L-arabinose transferase-like glycosyltransferase
LAGLWCQLGESLAITGAELLYWIRFLDVPLVAVFVWLSWLFSRRFFRDNFQERVAIPLLAAFFPQDIFYAITGDALSPVVFAAAFIMLLEIYFSKKSRKYHLFAGLLVAATFLTKASNIAVIPFAALVILIKIIRAYRQKQVKQYLPALIAFVLAAIVPIAIWLGRNYILFGDAVGAAASIKLDTWTIKPLSKMFNHPILTPSGFIYFISELTKTFWRGEFVWHTRIIASPFMDWFYVISSGVFLFALVLDKTGSDRSCRTALAGSLFVVIVSIVFLAFMSMR